MAADFRPLAGSRIYAQSSPRRDLPFVVASMFTANVRPLADRLKFSLEKLQLNFVLYEVPTIHCSISTKGTDDITFCKPNFIRFVLSEHHSPILYVDADVVFRRMPDKVLEFVTQRIDFAAYNWLADAATDAYMPQTVACNGVSFSNRFYGFSHSVDDLDPAQLIVSGAVQYYASGADPLLRHWLETINRFPRVMDDQVLDYTYNFVLRKRTLRTSWLPKGYCRYPWWIHVQPVLDHPEFPTIPDPTRTFKFASGIERFNLESTRVCRSAGPFPRDCLIDTYEKCLIRTDRGGAPVAVHRFATELWINGQP
jgi:hypothetical protein